ncbi:MAG: cysteine--tRNA ligase [Oscillospiraceae bacterium]|nr:cysteine--tRNA ligase [Oscillospiraceae bacterium]
MVDIREQSPLSFAYVGDAVYSLLVREYLVKEKRYNINKLNKLTVQYVSAHGQYLALQLLEEILTEEEQTMVKRGKNTSKATVAKHASVEEYRASTGFECMLGWLRLKGEYDRINYLVEYIIRNLEFDKAQ